MISNQRSYLYLLQLADTALPIGSTAHSFGIETLVAEEILTVAKLTDFCKDYIQEVGLVEVVYARSAFQVASVNKAENFTRKWLDLNKSLSALKLSRESREASATLGKRFLQLVAGLEPEAQALTWARSCAQSENTAIHHACAFGLVGGILQVDKTMTLLAYLQQSVASQISACQRLLPLGQKQAASIQWHLKSTIIEAVQLAENANVDNLTGYSFAPLADVASMRHPQLTTRLFIS